MLSLQKKWQKPVLVLQQRPNDVPKPLPKQNERLKNWLEKRRLQKLLHVRMQDELPKLRLEKNA